MRGRWPTGCDFVPPWVQPDSPTISDETARSAPADAEIGGGVAPIEYQTASLYRAASDADGYYRLPPLSRVASVRLHADGAPAKADPVIRLDYRRYEDLVDVIYP